MTVGHRDLTLKLSCTAPVTCSINISPKVKEYLIKGDVIRHNCLESCCLLEILTVVGQGRMKSKQREGNIKQSNNDSNVQEATKDTTLIAITNMFFQAKMEVWIGVV